MRRALWIFFLAAVLLWLVSEIGVIVTSGRP